PPVVDPDAFVQPQRAAAPKRPDFDFNFDELPPLEKSETSPAKQILEQALEQSVAKEGFSLEELLSNIERQLPRHRPRVQPLPSWIRESQTRGGAADTSGFMTSEPDFLPEVLPEVEAKRAEYDFSFDEAEVPDFEPFGEPEAVGDDYDSRFVDQLTIPSAAQPIESLPEETQWLESPSARREEAPVEDQHEETQSYTKPYPKQPTPAQVPFDAPFDLPENLPERVPDELPEFPSFTAENFNTSFELLAAFEVVEDEPEPYAPERYEFTVGRIPMPPPLEEMSMPAAPVPLSAAADDPRIAQLALNLTEASLELTAEATVLTRRGEIVAYAGQLAEDEILELRPFIPMDGTSIPSGSQIRFVSATDSPKNYMLYSARTDDDLILSLVFASTTPLRDIRRQGARLAEALHSVPEPPPVELDLPQLMLLEPVDVGARTPYTFVWLVDDPAQTLDGKVGQAIRSALRVQLGERGWVINDLRAEEDYLYLLADVPGDTMPYEIIRDLKRRSAEIAHKQNADLDPDLLWSDGYLVVAPGRSLDVDEIQQFINFERMG
ncbi:MAG: transposase, partial [Anaerolinea sp.]|nr:transposase [Anaerolinea sp.]